MDRPIVSIISPIFNELDNIKPFYTKINNVLHGLVEPCEVIFVNDGSTDGSIDYLKEIASRDPRVKVISFTRNFGQTPAIMAGIEHAQGDLIVTIDSDLQNDPEDIPLMIELIKDNKVDVVSGWRNDRKDHTLTRRIPSFLANRLISWLTGIKLHDYGCSLKIYRADVLKKVNLYGELHRFIPALVAQAGGKIMEVKVRHHPRSSGKSKYGLERVIKVFFDLFLLKFLSGYSTRPIHFFGQFGLAAFFVGFLLATYVAWLRIVQDIPGVNLITYLILAMLFLLVGVQTILMGLLGEIGIRTYHECQHTKKIYVIEEIFPG
ncbi:MAG: glycosyltransferase family 2 protein [Proteobacteria bacterium]|nr:glycosyltransferase family 2 protein [Pseudomonadota bacterium]